MSKSYKVKRRKDPKTELKKEAKRVNWKRVLTVFGVTVLIFALYELAVMLEFIYIVHIYAILGGVLALVYGILNRGFARFDPDSVIFPKSYTEEQKKELIEKELIRRRKARLLLIPLIGILITLAIDTVYLIYLMPIMK